MRNVTNSTTHHAKDGWQVDQDARRLSRCNASKRIFTVGDFIGEMAKLARYRMSF